MDNYTEKEDSLEPVVQLFLVAQHAAFSISPSGLCREHAGHSHKGRGHHTPSLL